MFGKPKFRNIAVSLVLLGYCVYILRLSMQNKMTLYIHPRYTVFACIMCCLAAVILCVNIFYILKTKPLNQLVSKESKFLNTIVVVILLLAFVLPAKTLSSEAVGKKSLNTPTSNESPRSKQEICPELEPVSIDGWVYQISEYAPYCSEGHTLVIEGYVFESSAKPLPPDMYYLGRTVISCCIIDSRAYALPIAKGDFPMYPKDTWLRVTGTLEEREVNGAQTLVLVPSHVKETQSPEQPYNFYSGTPPAPAEPLTPAQN